MKFYKDGARSARTELKFQSNPYNGLIIKLHEIWIVTGDIML